MDLAALQNEVSVGQPRPLSPGRLVRELEALERELASQAGLQIRLTTMNLLVVCSTPEDAVGLGPLLRELGASFPSRCFVAVLDRMAPRGELVGWASYACMPQRRSQVCCEQVVLYGPGSEAESIPSLVLATMHPDLPTLSWWRGDPPFGTPLLEQLVEPSNRVVFDSRSFSTARMSSILALIQDRYHQEQAFSDLSWGRLEPWREEIAALFDPPEATPCLQDLAWVEIAHRPDGGAPPPQPLLLAGWLASRLDWSRSPLEAGEGGWRARLAAGRVDLRLVPSGGDGQPGDLAGFRCATSGGREFRVHAPRPRRRSAREGASGELDEAARRTVERMGRELSIPSRDVVYQEALEAALELVPARRAVEA